MHANEINILLKVYLKCKDGASFRIYLKADVDVHVCSTLTVLRSESY